MKTTVVSAVAPHKSTNSASCSAQITRL
jgi:hypothetical protein